MYRLQRSSRWLFWSAYSKGVVVQARANDASALSIVREEHTVNNIVWWVGAIVIIVAILGFLGFR